GADRGERVDNERDQDHGAPPKAVRERSVKQEHHGEGEEIARHRLLDLERGRVKRLLDPRERGKVRVDRERTESGQRREQRREAPAETSRAEIGPGRAYQRGALDTALNASRTFEITVSQSPRDGWRKRRALAYQGESSRSSSQR